MPDRAPGDAHELCYAQSLDMFAHERSTRKAFVLFSMLATHHVSPFGADATRSGPICTELPEMLTPEGL